MNYEQKYKYAIEQAKKELEACGSMDCDAARQIFRLFPELAESKYERIRKEIIRYLDRKIISSNFGGDIATFKEWIDWLKKQSEIDKTSYDIAEKEKYDFVSGQFIECRKSFNEFKEDNSYWLEYVGNDTYIGRSDNILNKKFHITPRQLYRLFTQEHCPKENNANEETNAPIEYGKYVDECLNEASKHFFSEGEDIYSVTDLFYAGVRCGQSWFEKQNEQASTDENKPKFKIGDFIVHNNSGDVCQITEIRDDKYCIWPLYAEIEGYLSFIDVDNDYHLWTIQDATDGDVLCFNDDVFILKYYVLFNKVVCHCCYNKYFVPNHAYSIIEEDFSKIHPATKEQRDFLFNKMEELGYEWDAEKKELKKIEQKPTQWSEKDETTLACLIGTLTWVTNNNYHCSEDIPKYMCWLENLKQRLNR